MRLLNRQLYTYSSLITGVALAICLPGPVALADDVPVALGVSPAIAEIAVNRGQSVQREFIVENKTATAVAVRVHAENFEASDPYGAISFNTDDTRQYASSSWIKLDNPNLILDPRQRITLKLSIDCPPDAEPGGHYSTIFFEPISATAPGDNSKLSISQRVGALLFITVNGNNLEQGQVLGAKTDGSCDSATCSFKTEPWREWGPVPFSFQFQNTGTIHVKVAGKISVTDLFNRVAGDVALNQQTVLPGSSRSFQITWPREILFGRYTATLNLTYGTQLRTETAHVSFWVMPWRALAGLLAALAMSFGILMYKNRKNAGRH